MTTTPLKTENLTLASRSAEMLCRNIRAAHTDAVNSGNDFAEIVLYGLIEEAQKLEQKISRAAAAAK